MRRFNFLDFFTNNGLKKHSALDTVPQSLLHFLLSFSSPREINPNWPVLWEKKIVPLVIGLLLHGGGQGSQLWVVKYREQKEGSLSSLSISSGLDLALPGLAFKYPSDSLPSASLFFSRGRVSSPTAGLSQMAKMLSQVTAGVTSNFRRNPGATSLIHQEMNQTEKESYSFQMDYFQSKQVNTHRWKLS